MSISRRKFIKSTCIGATCLCGFSSIVKSETVMDAINATQDGFNKHEVMLHRWITEVLSSMDTCLDKDALRNIVKSTSVAHHENLNMESFLSPYIGNTDQFISFLEKEWGWKISYENEKQVIIADENKSRCVCPLIKNEKDRAFPALCYCSEGFAERMFSMVYQKPVSVTVISSVQWGDPTCIYKIHISP